jgi:hypothetical protein
MGINLFERVWCECLYGLHLSTDAWHMLRIILLENQQSLQLQIDCSCQVLLPLAMYLRGFVPQSLHHNFVEENFVIPSISFICINQISGQVLQFVFLHLVWLTWE